MWNIFEISLLSTFDFISLNSFWDVELEEEGIGGDALSYVKIPTKQVGLLSLRIVKIHHIKLITVVH